MNRDQRLAIGPGEGPFMLLAGPGTGKTAVITERVRELLRRGVPGENILVITFTRAAAREMEERFVRAAAKEREERELSRTPGTGPRFGTFHSVFYEILKESGMYRNCSVCTETEKARWLREILDDREAEKGFPELAGARNACIRVLLEEFSARKAAGEGGSPENPSRICGKELFDELFSAYEDRRKKCGKLDFDDMIGECLKLLRTNRQEREKWQKRCRHVLIDEFQDASRAQYEGAKLLAWPENNLFAVGDDDQSIYSFRGADPGIMRSFPRDFPSARVVALRVNYRSAPEIFLPAKRLIVRNEQRFPKSILCAKDRGSGEIAAFCFPDAEEEADWIAGELLELHRKGMKWREAAVLYRSESVSLPLLQSFLSRRIPYQCRELPPFFYDRWMIRDILSYLKLAAGEAEREDVIRAANRPDRRIGRAAIELCWERAESGGKQYGGERETKENRTGRFFRELIRFYGKNPVLCRKAEEWRKAVERMKRMSPSAAVVYVLLAVEYEKAMKKLCRKGTEELDTAAELLAELKERARGFRSLEEMLREVREEREAYLSQERIGEGEGVRFLTMHGAKGLQFPVVFLPALNEGVLPHQMAGEENQEEERRLFYVALTRAERKLYLTCARHRYEHRPPVSRFLLETGIPIRETGIPIR